MRIALPKRRIFDRLSAGSASAHTVIRAPQPECEMLLRTARAELALISPLGYGSAPSLSDYHIVGTTCLVANENTALASIRFRGGLREPRTYYAPEPDDFLTTIGLLLLAEQHELRLKPSATLDGADTVIAWNDSGDFPDHPAAIDLTEEWALTCVCSLPIGVWVCRSDLAEEFDVPSITTALAGSVHEPREYLDSGGYLQWRWDDDVKGALVTTLEMLYYHRYIPSLPKVKLL